MKKETGSDAGGYDLNPKKGYLPHNDALKPKQRPGRQIRNQRADSNTHLKSEATIGKCVMGGGNGMRRALIAKV